MVSDLLNINSENPPANAWGWVAPEQDVVEIGTEE